MKYPDSRLEELRKSPYQKGRESFRYLPFLDLAEFLTNDSIQSSLIKYSLGEEDRLNTDKESKITWLKNGIAGLLKRIQSARGEADSDNYYSRIFLQYMYKDDWENKTQSIINTVCSRIPEEWKGEIEDKLQIDICKEDEIDYSSNDPLLVFQEATEEDMETTIDFVKSFFYN